MIRTINFLFVAITGLMCLGLYRVAEAARVADANVMATAHSITREQNEMVVLQAEWARLTQPGRVAALAARHLKLTDKPAVELSSLTSLPRRGDPPLVPEGNVRDAKVVVPQTQSHSAAPVAQAGVEASDTAPAAAEPASPSDMQDDAALKLPLSPNTGA